MKKNKDIKFKAGKNIAMKVPTHRYDQTIHFYNEILGFQKIEEYKPEVVFEFGDKNLWIDKVKYLSQSEIWLEVECNDIVKAKKYFHNRGIQFRDEIEKLPNGLKALWIASPNDIIHLISES